ncbi:putative Small monomeric GTPase [Rhodotorula taiwanensis]|uniref:Putative Small monomeric GTPase n=1 Tax=Rhodotorula taiwanensis TaxID=741276 RepID=A0A2S5B122_9BASI|nr:putative Small monomeric GTPase [Rhodotorula taiwanensis]
MATTPSGKLIPPKMRKVALLGSRSVGKSSLTVQFVDQHFVDSYYPTIENTFTKIVKYKGSEYQLDITDTAGQDEFSILSSRHAVGLHGWVLVYSVSSRSSFEMCSIIREKILNYTGREKVPMVLVGNKSDLAVQRQVTKEEGAALAANWGLTSFVETSARTGENVNRVFDLIVAQIESELNPQPEEKQSGGCVIA